MQFGSGPTGSVSYVFCSTKAGGVSKNFPCDLSIGVVILGPNATFCMPQKNLIPIPFWVRYRGAELCFAGLQEVLVSVAENTSTRFLRGRIASVLEKG